jgi:hypothetical protein
MLSIACNSNQPFSAKDIKLEVHPSLKEIKYDDGRLAMVDFIEEYLNLMFDSSISYRNTHWQSELLYGRFDRLLRMSQAKDYLIQYPPQLLGIRKDDQGNYRIKLNFRRANFPEKIMELIVAQDAAGKYYFIEGLGYRVRSFNQRTLNGLTFYYSPQSAVDTSAEQKVVDYNQQLANYFGSAPRNLRVIVCKDLKDYANLMGEDYNAYLNLDRQTGGRAMPDEDLFISANGSAYYPHELVHIYTAAFDPHPFFDEGMATYLGGSGGISLVDHLKKAAEKRDNFDFSNPAEFKYIYENYGSSYLIGGLLLKLADEEYGGKSAVFKLLRSGREDEDLVDTIEAVFKINEKEFDAFIKAELAKYENDQR